MCQEEGIFLFHGKWYCYNCYYLSEEAFDERMEEVLEDVGDGGF